MSEIVEVRAIVRIAMLDRVIRALKEAGVPRLTVTRVHAIGAGVDPAAVRFSFDEGSEYADKAMVQFICNHGDCHRLDQCVCEAARTSRRGDGIVSVHPVLGVTKIRTGDTGAAALA